MNSHLTASIRVNNDLPIARFAELAVAAEQAGFDQIWLSNDLLLNSALVALPIAATRTSHIALGTGILNPYTIHPAEMAMFYRSLAQASGDRALAGIAAGAEDFLSWIGVERKAPLDTVGTALDELRYLLGSGEGRPDHWSDEAPKPDVEIPIPIYMGAMSPRMLELAGEKADGVLPLLFPPERYPEARDHILTGAARAGREPNSIDIAACVWCSLADDAGEARDALADRIVYYGPSFSPHVLNGIGLSPEDLRPARAALLGGDREEARRLLPGAARRLGIAGSSAEMLEQSLSLVETGATHISFGPPLGPRPLEAIHLLGSEVLPRLRA